MERVITVRTIKGNEGKLKLDECLTWAERYPRKTYVIYLHRHRKGRWFREYRYHKSKHRNRAYEIETEWAVHWLIEEEHEMPADCESLDERVDIGAAAPPKRRVNVVNLCLNCARLQRSALPVSDFEWRILNALGDATMIGRDIAKKAGLPYGSHFRETLSRLKVRRLVEYVTKNKGGTKGYRRFKECPDKT